MLGSHRAGEITFYEELGVGNQASAMEIRDAFRALARMLHPDQQTDPQLKEIAERQMRKLNRIYSVLSDPERRRRYDEMLEDDYPHIVVNPRSEEDLRRVMGRAVWGGAVLLCGSLLVWLWVANTGSLQSRPREVTRDAARDAVNDARTAKSSVPVRGDSPEVSRLRADLRALTAQRDAAIQELGRLRRANASVPEEARSVTPQVSTPPALTALSPLPTMTELPSTPRVPALPVRSSTAAPAPAPVRPDRPSTASLAGFWFYVKPALGQENQNRTLYPPEFIEATIIDENGVLKGRYRSRFQIVDRAISPDVNFTFTVPTGATGPYYWTGAGGAKGEVTLKLTSENQLRLEWSASELGSQQGLASGTAVLRRRIE